MERNMKYIYISRIGTRVPALYLKMTNNTRQKLADSFSDDTFPLSLPQLDSHTFNWTSSVWHISWLWPTMIDRQTSNVTYSSAVAHQYTALLTLPYQGCLPSCELHSRSLAVGGTGACDLEIAHTWLTQSRDCAHVLRISRLHTRVTQSQDSENAQRISRLHKFSDCTEHIRTLFAWSTDVPLFTNAVITSDATSGFLRVSLWWRQQLSIWILTSINLASVGNIWKK